MLSNTATPYYYGQFRDAVLRGEIPVNREVSMEMNRIDALIRNPDIYYDDEAVEGWILFCENELTLTDGSDLHMLDSFKIWGEEVFGWWYFVEKSVYEPYEDGGGHYVIKQVKKRLINKQYLIVTRGAATQDMDALALVALQMQEDGVELDHVHVQGAQHVQRRVAGAEVVHEHHDPHVAQALRRVAHDGGVVRIGGFGDLGLQDGCGQVVLLQQARDVVGHVDRVEVDLGDVDGERHDVMAGFAPGRHIRAHLVPDIAVEVGDEPVFLEYGDELGRRDHIPVLSAHARERLDADHLAARCAALGLQQVEQTVVLQGVFEFREREVFFLGFPVHRWFEQADAVAVVGLRVHEREGGVVVDVERRQAGLDHGVAEGGHERGRRAAGGHDGG